MATHVWAKVFGWGQFLLQLFVQVGTQLGQPGSAPHGAFNWIAFVASLATAIAVHGAASTSGTT